MREREKDVSGYARHKVDGKERERQREKRRISADI